MPSGGGADGHPSGGARIVVIGLRSAVFAPVRELGLIVVDEEHDALQQDSDPRYDARAVAAERRGRIGAVTILGSATPPPRHDAESALKRLAWAVGPGPTCPRVEIVDMVDEANYPLCIPLPLGGSPVSSTDAQEAILLLNRRGLAPALLPGLWGGDPLAELRVAASPAQPNRHASPLPSLWRRSRPRASRPACGSPGIARLGTGTQRLERELARSSRGGADRLDTDSMHDQARADEAALRRFAAASTTVLLGTQMIAKGHHFAGVELAAVVDADTSLALPDFRAEERTFQLITQLAGRSGRDAPGRVLVQTFQPDARPITYAARHDVRRFLAEELDRRRDLGYPPFSHLVRIVVTGPALAPAYKALEELRDRMREAELLGPAPLLRLRGRYRAQLIAKTDRPRAVATQAAQLLAAAPRCAARGSRSSSTSTRNRCESLVGHTVDVKRTPPEEILGKG